MRTLTTDLANAEARYRQLLADKAGPKTLERAWFELDALLKADEAIRRYGR